jgi:drug/metabolite transporter (DMT)-like permease
VAQTRRASDTTTSRTGYPEDDVRVGILLVSAFSLTIPVVGAAVKILGQSVSIPQITWTRFLLQIVIIGAILAATSRANPQPWPTPIWPLVLRGAVICLGSGLFYAALSLLPLAEATAILFIQPLILTCLAALLLGEKVGLVRVMAVAMGLVGALVIVGPNFDNLGWASLLPVGAAFCFACASLITRKWASVAGPFMFQFVTAIAAVAILSATMSIGIFGELPALTPQWPTSTEAALLLFTGIGSTITNLMLVQSFRIAPPSALAPFFYLEIVGAVLLGILVFGQFPGLTTIAGAALVIGAGLVVWKRESRNR